MYKLYIQVEQKFLPVGQEKPSVFKEEQLEVLQGEQSKAIETGKLLWIVYLNPEKYVL